MMVPVISAAAGEARKTTATTRTPVGASSTAVDLVKPSMKLLA